MNVDECYYCGGFFLDSGELHQIRETFMSDTEREGVYDPSRRWRSAVLRWTGAPEVDVLRLFLAASALVWLPYGLLCFFDPGYLVGVAGVSASSATGTIELRAMYGGLQSALGILAGAAYFEPTLRRPALLALAFVCAGLFMARLLGALLGMEFSSYTLFALLFELLSCAFAARLLALLPRPAA